MRYANRALESEQQSVAKAKDLERSAELTIEVLKGVMGVPGDSSQSSKVEKPVERTDDFAESILRPGIALLAGVWAALDPSSSGTSRGKSQVKPGTGGFEGALLRILGDEGRPHRNLIQLLGKSPELGSPATAYAIACYHAGTKEADTKEKAAATAASFRALLIAITDPALKIWAPHDPCLISLRGDHADRWAALFPKPASDDSDVTKVEITLRIERE